MKKTNCFFENKYFQRVSRIVLGPPKHVLHLVWSAYFISSAVGTALKVARTPQILGERRPVFWDFESKKRTDFIKSEISVKFIAPNKGLISIKKMGVRGGSSLFSIHPMILMTWIMQFLPTDFYSDSVLVLSNTLMLWELKDGFSWRPWAQLHGRQLISTALRELRQSDLTKIQDVMIFWIVLSSAVFRYPRSYD